MATASVTYFVQVTGAGLCGLVEQWVSQKGIANSLCQKVRHGSYGAFANEVRAQAGKAIPTDKAAILAQLSSSLPN